MEQTKNVPTKACLFSMSSVIHRMSKTIAPMVKRPNVTQAMP